MNQMKKIAVAMFAVLCMACLPFMQAKAEEEMMLIYAQVPSDWENPCVWAWADDGTNAFEAWPGGSMKADEENQGWYYTHVEKSAGSNVIINASEGTVQTKEYKTNDKDAWFTITDAETVEVSNDQQTKGELPIYEPTISINVQVPEQPVVEVTAEDMIQVHAQVPSDWLLPSLWAWSAPDGTNVFTNWPGQELTEGIDGWYTYEIPNWVNSIIVNGNLGEVQTSDITIEPKDLWVVIKSAEEYEIYYEEPAPVQNVEEADSEKTEDTLPSAMEETNTSNTGLIIGIVVAALAVAGIGGIAYKKKRK